MFMQLVFHPEVDIGNVQWWVVTHLLSGEFWECPVMQ